MSVVSEKTTTTIRGGVAEGRDGEAIRRLAELSRSKPPRGAVLFAEVDGDPVAAIGIIDRREVSDPARSTVAMRMRLRFERLYVRAVVAFAGV
jgi:hypothetical protein